MTCTRLPQMEGSMTAEGRETYHVETGPGFRLPCWCELGADHTFAEWDAWMDEQIKEKT